MWRVGDWVYLREQRGAGRVVDLQEMWGQRIVSVWVPDTGTVLRLSHEQLAPFPAGSAAAFPHRLAWVVAAARVVDSISRGDVFVAPLSAPVIPLPHQIAVLSRAMNADRLRLLLADEVGLGKTIEAGLILRELKIRGLARRILVVAPAGLVTQWVQEMRLHFGEEFHTWLPDNNATGRPSGDRENRWRQHDQFVCSLDSVKPLDRRRGWTEEDLARHNRERCGDLVAAGWDLVIVDEAHRLGGSHEHVARFRLGEALAGAAPCILLLSATPHQGKTDAFRRLLSLLDPQQFVDETSIAHDRVAPYVIRTEKRQAIDAEGRPLFKPRLTQLLSVPWTNEHSRQRDLYEAVSEYVRLGYNRARAEKRTALFFLMILMQRLVTSSTRAIRTTLEKRREALDVTETQLRLPTESEEPAWRDLDAQEQLDALLAGRLQGLADEQSEVDALLAAARRCEAGVPDVKAQALLDALLRLQREENEPDLKVLIFTEFLPTQAMLAEFLVDRGFAVACLNGGLDLDERREVQEAFAGGARILISTDAGGEGLNLQFCHVVVNYDLPWNPMKLEQRIGRVDRIGQRHVVRAVNLALQDSVELRVREVLEDKLARILAEFGVDKLSDVLDSEVDGATLEDLFADAVLSGGDVTARIEAFAAGLRSRAIATREGAQLLLASHALDAEAARRVLDHPLPYWIERLVLGHLRAQAESGGSVRRDAPGWQLGWPDGSEIRRAVFLRREAEESGGRYLSLADQRVRALLERLPLVVPGQPVARVDLPGISDKVAGTWSLWRIAAERTEESEQRVLPVFVDDGGTSLGPTARAIWDRLLDVDLSSLRFETAWLSGSATEELLQQQRAEAERQGAALLDELMQVHQARVARARRRDREAFESRARSLEGLGLPQLHDHRLRELEREKELWAARLAARDPSVPSLNPIVVLRIARSGELP